MTRKSPANLAESVRQRLLNLARHKGEDFQVTLNNYFLERFLYRLSRSKVHDRFVLKGALLLRLWRSSLTAPARWWTLAQAETGFFFSEGSP